jgi:hypothetical protein
MINKKFICFSVRNKRKKSSRNEIGEILNNSVEINNTQPTTFTGAPSHLNQQQSGFYTSYTSYGNVPSSVMNNSYTPPSHHDQQSAYFTNYLTCYKCNNMVIYNTGQFYQCMSCTRLRCFTCSNGSYIPSPYYYRCEYCSLESALQMTRCL